MNDHCTSLLALFMLLQACSHPVLEPRYFNLTLADRVSANSAHYAPDTPLVLLVPLQIAAYLRRTELPMLVDPHEVVHARHHFW